MNEGTPLGSEYNKPMAVVLKGPTAELYLYLYHIQKLQYSYPPPENTNSLTNITQISTIILTIS
jgi:hypothetical protein